MSDVERHRLPAIRTNLDRAELPAGQTLRPHLLKRLDQGVAARVTLLSAAAGYGKSTLVARWLEGDSSPPAAWLSLDGLDKNLERFARYVVAGISSSRAGLPPRNQMRTSR